MNTLYLRKLLVVLLMLHMCVTDVQWRAAGNGGAVSVGPQYLHVVSIPVCSTVPRVGGLRAGRRAVASCARLRRCRRHGARAPAQARIAAPEPPSQYHLLAPGEYTTQIRLQP